MADTSKFIHDKAEQKKRTEEKRKAILEFLASETFSTSDIIGKLLELSRTAVYRTLKSMEKEELIKLYEIEYELAQKGKQTIWGLTPTGALLAADLDDFHIDYYEAGRVAASTIAHSVSTQRVRVFAQKNGWTEWKSGKKLKQLAIKDKTTWLQIPDAVGVSPDGKVVAFEIERTVKTTKRYESIVSNYAKMFLDKTVDEVIYICPENITNRLQILISKINKLNINGKIHPMHEKVLERIKFTSFSDWSSDV